MPKPRVLRRWAVNFAFTLPFLIFYGIFILFPVVQAVLMSFFNWDLLGSTREWIGLENYTHMLGGTGLVWDATSMWMVRLLCLVCGVYVAVKAVRERDLNSGRILLIVTLIAAAIILGIHPGDGGSWSDPRFWNAMKNTAIFTLVSTPIIAGLGLIYALLLQRGGRVSSFYRAALFVPYVLPVSVATLIWGYMLNPSRGIVARFTEYMGWGTISWLSDPQWAMTAIVVTTVWWTVGFNLILFGAGLQDIDPTLYEAASLDGANSFQKFVNITLPGLRHATVLVLVTQIIASFQIFGQVNIMTAGGPGGTTDVLVRYIYQTGFRDTQLGYASAMSLVLFVLMVFISLIQFLISRQRSR